jgi:hypothetical protein
MHCAGTCCVGVRCPLTCTLDNRVPGDRSLLLHHVVCLHLPICRLRCRFSFTHTQVTAGADTLDAGDVSRRQLCPKPRHRLSLNLHTFEHPLPAVCGRLSRPPLPACVPVPRLCLATLPIAASTSLLPTCVPVCFSAEGRRRGVISTPTRPEIAFGQLFRSEQHNTHTHHTQQHSTQHSCLPA